MTRTTIAGLAIVIAISLTGCTGGDTIEGCRDAVIAAATDNTPDPNMTTDRMPACDGLTRKDQIEAVDQATVQLLDDTQKKLQELGWA